MSKLHHSNNSLAGIRPRRSRLITKTDAEDIARAAAALMSVGVAIKRVVLEDRRLTLETDNPVETPSIQPANPWDEIYAPDKERAS